MTQRSDSKLMELEFKVKKYEQELKKLQSQNDDLMKVIQDNDLADEVDAETMMSDEEFICVNEIKSLRRVSEAGSFGKEEALILDILHKNLRAIRGKEDKPKKTKKLNKAELFSIVDKK